MFTLGINPHHLPVDLLPERFLVENFPAEGQSPFIKLMLTVVTEYMVLTFQIQYAQTLAFTQSLIIIKALQQFTGMQFQDFLNIPDILRFQDSEGFCQSVLGPILEDPDINPMVAFPIEADFSGG